MSDAFFERQLYILGSFCVGAVLFERWIDRQKHKKSHHAPYGQSSRSITRLEENIKLTNGGPKMNNGYSEPSPAGARHLARKYLLVYALVMGADWLQGPYVYSLYRDQYGYSESTVAFLFVTGFTSAGLAAPVVGVWADTYGRKYMALYFCITYCITCICTLSGNLGILLLGRVLGGFSTSILFSVFEAWLISSAQAQSLSQTELSTIMGHATLINGFVAAASGIFSNRIVDWSGQFTSPFIASALLLVAAWFVIRATWSENYGSTQGQTPHSDLFQLARLKQAWEIARTDLPLLVLVFTQTCFEGSMYLFVFEYVPSLQEAAGKSLPLGYIFSAFMLSLMIGSLIYTSIISHANSNTSDPPLVLHAKLSSLLCTVAAFTLAASTTAQTIEMRFWAFCGFEACVGLYYPIQGSLRSSLIPSNHRATLSALFRVPLNAFVTIVMLSGFASARLLMFTGCSIVLGLSAVTTAIVVLKRAEDLTFRLTPKT